MTPTRTWAAMAAALFLVAVLVGALVGCGGTQRTAPGSQAAADGASQGGAVPRFRMDADHEVYPTVGEITEATDTIVVGQVVGHSTEPGVSPGVDAAGDPLPAIPHTDHLVSVAAVVNGPGAGGGAIHLVVAGGMTPEGEYVLEGAPQLSDGESALFFLVDGADGRFYPLAGGAAVAPGTGEGTFSLPADATGGSARIISQGEVAAAVGATASSDGGGHADGAAATIGGALAAHKHSAQKHRCPRKAKKKAKRAGKCVKRKHHKHRQHKPHRSRGHQAE
jgi:hypothetical protein